MVSSSIQSSEIRFGECNKELLEEVIFYGVSLGADFVELFIENSDNSNIIKVFSKLPIFISNGYQLIRLYLLKPLKSDDFQPSIR